MFTILAFFTLILVFGKVLVLAFAAYGAWTLYKKVKRG